MEAFIFPPTETILSTITPPIKNFLVLSARYDCNYIITYFWVIGKCFLNIEKLTDPELIFFFHVEKFFMNWL